jgi:HTH-type transcriptional regulator/antitoxin HigA
MFIMAQRKITIKTTKDYNAVMLKIDALMKKGEDNLTNKEAVELKNLALVAQAYEKSIYVISTPKTLEGMIELKMYELKLKQKGLAKLMGLGEAKLSQILNGKREPDVAFLKAAHKKLGIDASFLLNHV